MRPFWLRLALLTFTSATLACSAATQHAAPEPRAPSPSEAAPLLKLMSATAPRLSPPAGKPATGQRRVDELASLAAADSSQAPTFRQPLVTPERTRAVVLLYHAFDVGTQPLGVSSFRLDRHLCFLAESGVEIVSLTELVQFLEGTRRLPERVAVITIDDGLLSTYTKAWPVLRRHQARFAIGLPTKLVQEPKGYPMMSWDQIREMVTSGLCEVASHGHAHRRLVDLPDRYAQQELSLSRDIIERETGSQPIAFFYPLGASDEQTETKVRAAGYRAAFGATGGAVALGSSSLLRIPRTGIFHSDTVGRFGWYFGDEFMQNLPLGGQARPRVTAVDQAKR